MSFDVDIALAQGRFQLDAKFSVPNGLTVLFGKSGSGKTTLINAVAGLLMPDRGRVRVGQRVLFDSEQKIALPAHKRRLGYIFQDARLFPHLSVHMNLVYGQRFLPRSLGKTDPEQIISLLGLEALLQRRPEQLSGGEKQRVAIGRALLAAPELLLADEPLTALDETRKLEILPYFERIRDELKLPVLYVSHAVSEVARLASTVVVLDQGRVTQVGSASEVLSDPQIVPTGVRNVGSVITAQLLQHHVDGLSELSCKGIPLFVPRIDRPIGTVMRLRVAAHEIILSVKKPEGLSALNILPSTITDIHSGGGPGALVTLETAAGSLLARVTQRSVATLELEIGKPVFAVMKSVAIAPQDIGRDHA